tara:strand:+ start:545 stop:877 length:333 start_codon:yes stop_codon:yes gene_type:complete
LNPLQEGRKSLTSYCQNILISLDQTLEEFYRARASGQTVKQAKALQKLKKYSLQLLLLEPFYRLNEGENKAQYLQKLCVLLANESFHTDSDEELHLLTSFYSTLADLSSS